MPRRSTLRLTKRIVDGLTVDSKDAIFWDRDLPGFGVRVYRTGRKVYVVRARRRGEASKQMIIAVNSLKLCREVMVIGTLFVLHVSKSESLKFQCDDCVLKPKTRKHSTTRIRIVRS